MSDLGPSWCARSLTTVGQELALRKTAAVPIHEVTFLGEVLVLERRLREDDFVQRPTQCR